MFKKKNKLKVKEIVVVSIISYLLVIKMRRNKTITPIVSLPLNPDPKSGSKIRIKDPYPGSGFGIRIHNLAFNGGKVFQVLALFLPYQSYFSLKNRIGIIKLSAPRLF
jgi:hypothetical protein